MTLQVIEQKLASLRLLWKEHPEKRPIYELQARALKSALIVYNRYHKNEQGTRKLIETLDN